MHAERDALNKIVLPKLNKALSKNGKSMQFSDLRWGIDTSALSEEEANKKILTICVDEIKHCKPYIIVLIGDRYGSVMNDEFILANQYFDEGDLGKSVTHLEITKGVFNNAEPDHVFIYFRNADYTGLSDEERAVFEDTDEEYRQKLVELKKTLRKEYGDQVREYSTVWDARKKRFDVGEFTEQVVADLMKCIEAEAAEDKALGILGSARKRHRNIAEELLESTKISGENFETFAETIHAGDNIYFRRDNHSNIHESAARFYESVKQYDDFNTDVLFAGNDDGFYSAKRVLGWCLYCLNDNYALGITNIDELSVKEIYQAIADNAKKFINAKKKQVFVLDGVFKNRYFTKDECAVGSFIDWIRLLVGDNIRFFVTLDYSAKCPCMLGRNCGLRFSTKAYSDIVKHDFSNNRKTINSDVFSRMIDKFEDYDFLRLFMVLCLNLNESAYKEIARVSEHSSAMEAINAFLLAAIRQAPDDNFLRLFSFVIANTFETEEEQKFAKRLLRLLASANDGERESDLPGLFKLAGFKWSPLTYAEFLARFSYFLTISDLGVVRLDKTYIDYRDNDTFEFLFSDGDWQLRELKYYSGSEFKDDVWAQARVKLIQCIDYAKLKDGVDIRSIVSDDSGLSINDDLITINDSLAMINGSANSIWKAGYIGYMGLREGNVGMYVDALESCMRVYSQSRDVSAILYEGEDCRKMVRQLFNRSDGDFIDEHIDEILEAFKDKCGDIVNDDYRSYYSDILRAIFESVYDHMNNKKKYGEKVVNYRVAVSRVVDTEERRAWVESKVKSFIA